MNKKKIQKVLKDKKTKSMSIYTFNNLKEAADSVETKMDNWKVQLLIAEAINSGKRAFGFNWRKIS